MKIAINLWATVFTICVVYSAHAQQYQDDVFWVTTEDSDVLPVTDGTPNTSNEVFNSILANSDVTFYGQAFPGSRNDVVKRIYEVKCNECNVDDLIDEMRTSLPVKFSTYRKQEVLPNTMMYDPQDYFWYTTTQNPNESLWHLKKIQADDAWDITLGSSDVKVAVIDTYFDLTHPDLQNKFVVNYDPYSNQAFNNCATAASGNNWHGTTVASLVAAETIESGGLLQAVIWHP